MRDKVLDISDSLGENVFNKISSFERIILFFETNQIAPLVPGFQNIGLAILNFQKQRHILLFLGVFFVNGPYLFIALDGLLPAEVNLGIAVDQVE